MTYLYLACPLASTLLAPFFPFQCLNVIGPVYRKASPTPPSLCFALHYLFFMIFCAVRIIRSSYLIFFVEIEPHFFNDRNSFISNPWSEYSNAWARSDRLWGASLEGRWYSVEFKVETVFCGMFKVLLVWYKLTLSILTTQYHSHESLDK